MTINGRTIERANEGFLIQGPLPIPWEERKAIIRQLMEDGEIKKNSLFYMEDE